jgi:hypothetical protein
LARDAANDLHDLVIEETAVARRSRARCDGGVEAVDVDRDIILPVLGDSVEHALGAESAYVAHGKYL